MKKFFLSLLFISPFSAFSMDDMEYEKRLYNIYLKHYKAPVSNSEWNKSIQNIPKQYKLKNKDNLWDLSDSFFKNSLYWSKLWVVNPKVENPHLIYKDNFIKFDPLALSQVNKSKLSVGIQEQFPNIELPHAFSKKALSEEKIPSSLPKMPIFIPVDNEIDLTQLQRSLRIESKPIPFYLSDELPNIDGEVFGRSEYGSLFGVSGDQVILKLNNSASAGTHFTVFKDKDKAGNFLSRFTSQANEHEIQTKGLLKIISYIQGSASLYKARIISAIDKITDGDFVFKGAPFVYNLSDKKIAAGSGVIIGSPHKTRIFLTTGSIVFLNKGQADGIYKEGVFFIRPNKENPSLFARPYNYEGAILGKLKVIHVSQNKATAVILSAQDKIYVGDSFSGPISSLELELIEDSGPSGSEDLLMDFEEIAPEEPENIDLEKEFETESSEKDNDFELEKDLENYERIDDFDEESNVKEERLKDYEKDENIEEHYEVDTLEWDEELSEGKEEVKQLNEGIKKSQEELEEIDEDLGEKQQNLKVLEDEFEQQPEEDNEDLKLELDEEDLDEKESDLELELNEEDLQDEEDLNNELKELEEIDTL